MKLLENWRDVLLKSWSVWIMATIGLIGLLQQIVGGLPAADLGISPRTQSLIVVGLSILGIVARVLKQGFSDFLKGEAGGVGRKGLIGIGAVSIAAAVAYTGPNEGLRLEPYYDVANVLTVCRGETDGVELGDKYTKAQCDRMFADRLHEFAVRLSGCLEAKMPEGMALAVLDWGYNVGIGAACSSTLVRLANAGELRAACHEFPRWVYAGGKRVRGLENRRARNERDCLAALDRPRAVAAPVPWWAFWRADWWALRFA